MPKRFVAFFNFNPSKKRISFCLDTRIQLRLVGQGLGEIPQGLS